MSEHEPDRALIFPGQGSQSLKMLDRAMSMADFKKMYAIVCDQLASDPIAEVQSGGENVINRNAISSILTVFLSALHLEQFRRENPGPALFAGYSVGQWSALYASGAIPFETLIAIVHKRAQIMDRALATTKSGMLAVIGLMGDVVESVCQNLRDQGQKIWISNYNAPAQYSLAGTLEAIQIATSLLQEKKPKKIAILPVAGAWHSPLLKEGGQLFKQFLGTQNIKVKESTVIDNVTGEFLPSQKDLLNENLGAHLFCPVLWEKGIQRLMRAGAKSFFEIGFGNMLTKYGFFIDRSLNHVPGLD